ncbi:DUF2516 family protein [Streptomyces clavuligerus]|uniref:DUF2516 domain-containing protein n=1 Tax=Streptomyces clavuligerus TaxID=1901 RepID=B5GP36_STRCL|nr:DUF2516 family protein [Streptomyces clavuligerus]ANW21910.1 hypothetical protein BB341_12555 [Streptomyces clavuligerus]AXU16539.1 DUF2516 family protein [Streptomyces clavuligerus]EDY48082.1 conserved hypothetical protein [Streptomyces clavuligerus]EFG08280.1 DUF2516 domain-containing protein [Streptomyces clavuligerus]MBY6303546.1 DUF2516 family protein [Streptomyces clavuligerus]
MLAVNFHNTLMLVVYLVFLVTSVTAFAMALFAREDAFRAADKQTKPFWLIILGIAVAVNLFTSMLFLSLAGLIASIVFFVDVRPALAQVTGKGGGRRGGSSSDGPYGPYNGGR